MKLLFCVLAGSLSATFSSPAFSAPFVVPPPKPSAADGGIFLEKTNQFTDAGIFNKIPEGFAEPRVRAVPPTQLRLFEFGSYPELSQQDFFRRGGLFRVRPYLYKVPMLRPQFLKDASPYKSGSVYLLPQWKRKEAQNPFGLARRQTSSTPTLDSILTSAHAAERRDREWRPTLETRSPGSGVSFYF